MLTSPTVEDLLMPSAVQDPYPFFARLRAEAPVWRVPGSDFHLVSTWDLVQEAVDRVDDFSSHLRVVLGRGADGGIAPVGMDGDGTLEQVLATADDPAHKTHRTLVMKALGRRIRGLAEEVDACAARLWEEHATNGAVDWVEAMADRLPLAMVARLVGLPDEDVPRLLDWAYDSTEILGGLVPEERLEQLSRASVSLYSYLDDALRRALAHPRDDLLGVLAAACAEGELDRQTAVLVLLQLVGAGGESTAGLIGTAARQLAEAPEVQQRLRAEPELLDPFLDECLRLEAPFRGHYRHVPHDAELGGVRLPAGSNLLLLWGSANRDSARFPDPDRLDLDRQGVRHHLAFGRGAHFCIGSSLARLEATASLRLLLARTSWIALDPDAPPRWAPSLFVRRHASLPLRFDPR